MMYFLLGLLLVAAALCGAFLMLGPKRCPMVQIGYHGRMERCRRLAGHPGEHNYGPTDS